MYLQLLYIIQRGELIQLINKITIKDEAIDQVGESSILSLLHKNNRKRKAWQGKKEMSLREDNFVKSGEPFCLIVLVSLGLSGELIHGKIK